MTHRTLQPQSLGTTLPAPSPSVLDIFVVWHPADSEGESICDRLFQHYHSDAFAGLAGSAVEVYGRSRPLVGNNDLPAPIVTVDGIVGNKERALNVDPAQYSVILPFIDENLIRASIKDEPRWEDYLGDIARLQSKCRQQNFRTLVLPILPKVVPDYSNSPIIAALMNRQGVNQGHIGNLNAFNKKHSIASEGELTRDLGQAIIQTLLKEPKKQDRLHIFISHSRSDIPKKDKKNITPTGVVSKVQSWIGKTKLADFVDIRDIQPGDDWNKGIIEQVRSGALLMVRTDHYSCREWTQREVLEAKKAEMPVVCLSALTEGEQRGSFLLDHVPTVAYPTSTGDKNKKKNNKGAQGRAIVCAINRLVDEALRQALWRHQEIPKSVSQAQESERRASNKESDAAHHNDNHGFDVAPACAPEPLMLTRFLSEHKSRFPNDNHLWLIHPDPPLLPPEHEIMVDLCTLASYERSQIHILTPRTFFAAGGSYGQGEPQLSTPNLALSRPLTGFTLGVSLSRNEDIKTLGLREKHLELVMAEVAQMMLLSGGCITYAGAVGTHIPDLTAAVLRVIRRYIEESKLQRRQLDYCEGNSSQTPIHVGDMFKLTVPCTSLQNKETRKTLIETSKTFASTGTVEILDKNGVAQSIRDADLWENKTNKETSMALSKIRSALPQYCDARLVIGGKTAPVTSDPLGYLGDFPGIIEEALYAVRNKQPLFVAGGFGGAAALLAHHLEIANNIPVAAGSLGAIEMNRRYSEAITEIRDLYDKQLSGLDDDDLRRLTTTQRASELAGLVIKGIAANR